MTVINPKSISGITSITLPSGGDNVLTIHTNNGVERFRIDSSGNVKVGSAATISPDGDVFFTGVCTATTLAGAASGLTGALPAISAANLTNVPAANVVGVHTSLTVTNATTTGSAVVGGGVTISESGIEASGIGITCANINGGAISGRRNLIINGNFSLDQRYGYAEQNPAVHGQYYADRWSIHKQQTNKFQIHTTNESLPANQGYPYALKCNVTNAFDPSGTAGAYFLIEQPIEGKNILGLKLGSSGCEHITVQFWVRSNVTGTYSVAIRNSAYDSHVVNEYSISSANTWEKKVITFANVITSGTWLTSTGVGLRLDFSLGAGSNFRTSSLNVLGSGSQYASSNDVNWINNANATFFLTGVQLEAGTQATPFERLTSAEELALCQRYYTSFNPRATGWIVSATQVRYGIVFPTQMRTTPTTGHTSSYVQYGPGGQQSGSLQGFSDQSDSGCVIIINTSGGMTTNAGSTGGITMTAAAEL